MVCLSVISKSNMNVLMLAVYAGSVGMGYSNKTSQLKKGINLIMMETNSPHTQSVKIGLFIISQYFKHPSSMTLKKFVPHT